MRGRATSRRARSGPRRDRWKAYLIAVLSISIGLAIVVALRPLTEMEHFAPMVGITALLALYAGIGPALLAIVIGWTAGVLVLKEPRWSLSLTFDSTADLMRWLLPLLVAIVAVWASWSLQRLTRQATRRADRAEAGTATARRMQELAAALSAAATPGEVAHELVSRVPAILGATGGSLGLIEGDELVIVDPLEAPRATLTPGLRLPLALRAPITAAARTGQAASANTRAAFEREFPDGARLAPRAAGAVAVPVRAVGRVVGAIGFPFGDPESIDEGVVALAQVAAGLGGQALERARLLDGERAARVEAELSAGRTRLLHEVANRLTAARTPREVADVIVAQVVAALGADGALFCVHDAERGVVRVLADAGAGVADGGDAPWRVLPETLPTPATDAIVSGRPIALRTEREIVTRYPGATELARPLGEHSSYTFPLSVGGRTLGAVSIAYRAPTTLDADTASMARTIARQAAVALDRSRRYEEELRSRRRAERLQVLTAALSSALTPADVARCFVDAVEGVGAASALLAAVDDDGGELRLLASRGVAGEVENGNGRLGLPLEAAVGSLALYDDLGSLRAEHPELEDVARATGRPAFALLPVSAGGSPLAVALLAWAEPQRLGEDERVFLETLASQCGLALDRARQYEAEREIAETLQRSVLPETIPAMEGVRVAARYLPGSSVADVGGDWFDTLTLRDGRLGFVVGDVVGKGVRAASTMAQLRNGMRALALEELDPARIVTKLNLLLDEYFDAPFATLAFLTLDPAGLEATLTTAGHLPPLVVAPDGTVAYLDGARGVPLGVDASAVYAHWSTTLDPGSLVVLYTDGLVERPDRSLDDGLALLADAARAAPREADAFVEAVVGALLGSDARRDDVALLAVQLDEARLAPFDLVLRPDLESLRGLRAELDLWLTRVGVAGHDASDILLAAWEAGANAIEHSGTPEVRVRALLSADRVRVTIADRGRWRAPAASGDRGLGLRLMRALMTTVDVVESPGGTTVVLERALTRERAGGKEPEPALD